jgi:1-acyl-sn-glycerol-3-phosphate acyltransferase
MFRLICSFIFNLMGWKITGGFPVGMKKYIIAVAPHTSNWDFVIGILARSVLHIEKTKFLAKASLFRPPFGWVFRLLGGYPVERSSSHDMVQQVAAIFSKHDEFYIGLAPEGTRKKVQKLKTGFYYIAKLANVPIIPAGFDFATKTVVVSKPFYPTDNFESDMSFLLDFYRKIKGRNPQFGIS